MAVIDVIKFNGLNRSWLIYHYPGDEYVFGTQLIVKEGQVAVFVKGGKALDYFTAGTYTLDAQNIPVLKSLINLPFGGRTPFTAEVYFINVTSKLDLYWGTTDAVSLIDPKYAVRLRVRAFGQFGIKISDYRVFLTELIGTIGDNDVIKYDLVVNYFKGLVVTKIKTIISDTIINKKISVLEIAPELEAISGSAQEYISEEFNRFGIEVMNFFIESINFPDEDFETINKILGEKAAFEIIGDHRYNVKRSFDVMEKAADNESGNFASAGIGLGVGAGAGLAVGNAFSNAVGNVVTTSAKIVICKKCGTHNTEGMSFCSNCGSKLAAGKLECSSCNKSVDEDAKFCPYCGTSMQKKQCPSCKHENHPGTSFCAECGNKLGD